MIVYLYEIEEWNFLKIPVAVPTILGTTISLILAFRTNASYDRWWEARKVWGAIVNDSRTLVRQTMTNFGTSDGAKKLAHRQIAWTYALARSLRNQEILPAVEPFLTNEELSQIKNHNNNSRHDATSDEISVFFF